MAEHWPLAANASGTILNKLGKIIINISWCLVMLVTSKVALQP
jgi:hypothetical protein